MFRAADFRGVEGVQRLAEFEHDPVGHIHHVVDGAQADGFEVALEPGRAGADFHAAHGGGGVIRAVRRGDAQGGEQVAGAGRGLRRGRALGRGGRERLAVKRGELAREADVAPAIAAVRGEFEGEDGVRLGKKIIDRRADGRAVFEDQQAAVVVAEAEFLGGAHHAVALDAAQFGALDFEIPRQRRARQGDGHAVANFIIFRAADDLARRLS